MIEKSGRSDVCMKESSRGDQSMISGGDVRSEVTGRQEEERGGKTIEEEER